MEIALNLNVAKQCLDFTKKVKDDPSFEFLRKDKDQPHVEAFFNDLHGFINFMTISINSEFEEIIIPERYYRVFGAITNVGLVAKIFGPF